MLVCINSFMFVAFLIVNEMYLLSAYILEFLVSGIPIKQYKFVITFEWKMVQL